MKNVRSIKGMDIRYDERNSVHQRLLWAPVQEHFGCCRCPLCGRDLYDGQEVTGVTVWEPQQPGDESTFDGMIPSRGTNACSSCVNGLATWNPYEHED